MRFAFSILGTEVFAFSTGETIYLDPDDFEVHEIESTPIGFAAPEEVEYEEED